MSTSIDNKIVSLKFDNNQFEQNVKTSMNTLERLKSSLNFDAVAHSLVKGFGNVEQSLSVGGIANSLDGISDRFSAMGIVGATVISNLTTQVMGLAQRLAGLAINPLVEGGKTRALNIEHAKFQLAGLDVEWDKIEDDISYGVQDTAYGLDAAATVASQLVASNVQLGDSMKTALRGVSGVAAMTSSSYEEIGHIFTTVAGQGRLMGMQLTQLSMKGINAAATLGKALGKSEAEIRDMVSKGQIDFATFAKAMDDAYGAHAKDANKTFTGAMSNTRAALSRIGAKFATPAYENLKDVLNGLIPVINAVNKALDPFVELAEKGMKKASESLVKAFKNFGKVGDKTKKTAKEIDKLDELAKRVIKGEFGNGEERRKQLENLGVSYDEVQSKVNALLGSTKTTNESTNLLVGIVKNFAEALKNVSTGLETAFTAIKDAFGSVFTESAIERIDVFSEKVSKFSEKFKMSEDTAKKFKATFEGLFGLFKLAETGVLGVIKALTPFANTVSDMIGSSLGGALDKLSAFGDRVSTILSNAEKGDHFYNSVKRIFDVFRSSLSPLSKKLVVFKDSIGSLFGNSFGVLNRAVFALRDIFTKEFDNHTALIRLSMFATTIEKIGETFVNFAAAVVKFVKPIKDSVTEMFPKTLSYNLFGAATAIAKFTEKLVITDSTAEKIKNTFKGFLAVLNIVGQLFSAVIRTIFPSTNALFKLGGGIATVTGGLGEWLVALSKNLEENDTFYNAIQTIVSLIKTGFETAKSSVEDFIGTYEALTGKELKMPSLEDVLRFVDKVKEKINNRPNIFDKLKDAFEGFFEWFNDDKSAEKSKAISTVVEVISALSDLTKNSPDFSSFFENLGKAFEKINFDRMGKILNIAFFLVFLNALIKVKDALYSLFDWDLYKNINGTFKSLKSAFTAASRDIQASVYVKIAQSIALLTGSLIMLSAVDGKKLAKAVLAMTALVVLLQTFSPENLSTAGAFALSVAVVAIASAMAILSASVASLGSIDVNSLANGYLVIVGLFAAIMIMANFLPSKSSGTLLKAAVATVIFASAIKSIASALKNISGIENAGESLAILAGAISIFCSAMALVGGISKAFPHVVFSFNAFSTALVTISLAVLVFSHAMKVISEIENAWTSFAVISSVIALFCSSMALFGAVSMAFPTIMARFTIFASSLVVMATAIVVLAEAMKAMDDLDNVWRTVGVISSVMTVFISTIALFGAVTTAFPTMMVRFAMFSASMVTLSLAMILLSYALKSIAEIEDVWKTIAAIASAMVVFISAIALVGALSTVFPHLAVNFIVLSVGIRILSGALALLAPALIALSVISAGGIVKSLLALAGTLAMFIGMAYVMSALAPAIVTFTGIFRLFVAEFIAFGFGLVLVAAAAAILATSTSGLTLFIFSLGPALTALVSTISSVLTKILEEADKLIPKFVEVIAHAVVAIAKTIADAIPTIVNCGMLLILGILQGINSHIGDILHVTNSILVKLIDGLALILPTLVDAGLRFMIKFINGLAEAIRNNTDAIWGAFKNLFSVVLEFGISVLQSFLLGIPGVGGKIYDALEKVKTGIREVLVPSEMNDNGKDSADALAQGISSGSGAAESAGKSVGSSAFSGLTSLLPDFSSVGESFGLGFGDSLEGQSGFAFDTGSDLGKSSLGGLESLSPDFSSVGESLGIDFSTAFGDTEGLAFDASSEVGDSAFEGLDIDMSSLGFDTGSSYSSGLGKSSGKAADSAASVADNSIEAIDSKYDTFRESGHNSGKGFALGLFDDSRAEVYDSAASLARVALNSMRVTLNEHSPSKETRQIGSYGGEGLSLGLLDMISVVRDAGEFVAQNAMEAMRKPLLRASEILTSDIDVEPTIRPVVDLSNVTQSAALMNGMLSGRTYNVGSVSNELSRKTMLMTNASASAAEANTKELGSIVRSIGELRSDIDALGEKIGRMNMVLDTGALVGAIAAPIDEALGQRYSLARRGV